jgi:hypothetical protein
LFLYVEARAHVWTNSAPCWRGRSITGEKVSVTVREKGTIEKSTHRQAQVYFLYTPVFINKMTDGTL